MTPNDPSQDPATAKPVTPPTLDPISGQATDAAGEVPRRRKPEPGSEPFGWAVIEFFSSFGLATVVLFFLFVITWLGTLEQIDHGLFDTQKKYFESAFLIHKAYDVIPLPLPGGALLLSLLFLNILCGGIIRLRKKPQTIGVLIAHFSIAFLILAGLVSWLFKKEWNMALWPGESSSVCMAFHDWQLELLELESDKDVWVIKDSQFDDLDGSKSRTFHNPDLPFELKLFGYVRNTEITHATGSSSGGQPVIDGFHLKKLPLANVNEQNVGGVLCTVTAANGGVIGESVLTPMANHPFSFEVDGRKFALSMNRDRWEVPFTVHLDKFIHEVYPKTNKPKVFRSEIRREENGREEEVKISMNKPMRYAGYIFFQASFGPENAGPNDEKYTVFTVVRNPSDHWPLVSCIVAAVGLLTHFIFSLYRYFQRRTLKDKKAQTQSAPVS
jgi:hypothetical protein